MENRGNDLMSFYLNAIEVGQPSRGEQASALGILVKEEGLNKERCIARHELTREHYGKMKNSGPYGMVTSTAEESPTASVPLSSLKVITLPELVLGKRHNGRVLFGQLCVQPFKISSVNTVLEDAAGRGVRVTIHNALVSNASDREVEARFPLGMRVAIKEPYFKVCVDGKTAVRVDNPADICIDDNDEKTSPADTSDAKTVEHLEAIRSDGNRLFKQQDWDKAASKYSECIDQAVRVIEEGGKGKTRSDRCKLDRVVMLTYSNRAEARLRLQDYKEALRDADEALEFDGKHEKTLVRKGKALNGLALFEKACNAFEAALEQLPQERSIMENLEASRVYYEQSRNGIFELSDYLSTSGGVPPSCADFLGPVEIRRVHYGYGRRGLFATKNVEAGGLLLVSNPVAITRQKSDARKVYLNIKLKTGSSPGNINTASQQDLIAVLANRVMGSKRRMAQLYSLVTHGKQEMEIPSMELFRPGSEWVPPDADNLELDIGLIRNISRLNAFGNKSDTVTLFEIRARLGNNDPSAEDDMSGIWLLPSFVNHSCAPNCTYSFVGNAFFLRPSRDVKVGEELTISYFTDIYETLDVRQAKSSGWYFNCKCERCIFEESFRPQLSKVSKAIPALKEAANVESRQEGHRRRAAKELAQIADDVEAVIRSRNISDPKREGWIRAAFLVGYVAKYRLAMDHHEAQARISALKLVVDSMTSVSVNVQAVQMASMLLREIEQRYLKQSQAYRLTEGRVLGICRAVHGKHTNKVLLKIIRKLSFRFDDPIGLLLIRFSSVAGLRLLSRSSVCNFGVQNR